MSGNFRNYVLRRIGLTILLLWGVATIMFLAARLVPGDVVTVMLGEDGARDPVARAAMIERFNLTGPLHEQYFAHMSNILRGDFGISMRTRRPVSYELARSIPASLELASIAGVFSGVLGILLGTLAAIRRGKFTDQIIRVVSLTGISMPLFWLALVALWLFNFKLGIAPGVGRLGPGQTPPPQVTGAYTVDALLAGNIPLFFEALSRLILPGSVLALFTMTLMIRFARSAVLEVLGEDFVQMAIAKGLSGPRVVFADVLRAAFVPIVTVLGLMASAVLAGGVLVEEIFNYPGIGRLMFQSAVFLDMPAMIGVGIIVGAIYILMNLVVDMLYGVIDPRIRISD